MFAIDKNGLLETSQKQVENNPIQKIDISNKNDTEILKKIDSNLNKIFKDKNGRLRDENGRYIKTDKPKTASEKVKEQKADNKDDKELKLPKLDINSEALEGALEKTGEAYYKAYTEWKGLFSTLAKPFKLLTKIKLPKFNKKENTNIDNSTVSNVKKTTNDNTKINKPSANKTNAVKNNKTNILKNNKSSLNKNIKVSSNKKLYNTNLVKASGESCIRLCKDTLPKEAKEKQSLNKTLYKQNKTRVSERQSSFKQFSQKQTKFIQQLNNNNTDSKILNSNKEKISNNKSKTTIKKFEAKRDNKAVINNNKKETLKTHKLTKEKIKTDKKLAKALKHTSGGFGIFGKIFSIGKKVIKFLPLLVAGFGLFKDTLTGAVNKLTSFIPKSVKSFFGFGDKKESKKTTSVIDKVKSFFTKDKKVEKLTTKTTDKKTINTNKSLVDKKTINNNTVKSDTVKKLNTKETINNKSLAKDTKTSKSFWDKTKSLFGFGGKNSSKIATKETAKIGEKTLLKTGGKSLLKKIPILGTLAGLGFAGQRAMGGDFKGAGLEALSGLVSNIPVVGTMASVGIDGYLAKRDYDKETNKSDSKTSASTTKTSNNNLLKRTSNSKSVVTNDTEKITNINSKFSKLQSNNNKTLLKTTDNKLTKVSNDRSILKSRDFSTTNNTTSTKTTNNTPQVIVKNDELLTAIQQQTKALEKILKPNKNNQSNNTETKVNNTIFQPSREYIKAKL